MLTDEIAREVEEEVNRNPGIIIDLIIERLNNIVCPKKIALCAYVAQKKRIKRKEKYSYNFCTWKELRHHPEVYPYRLKYYQTECICGLCNPKHNSEIKVLQKAHGMIQRMAIDLEGVYHYGT